MKWLLELFHSLTLWYMQSNRLLARLVSIPFLPIPCTKTASKMPYKQSIFDPWFPFPGKWPEEKRKEKIRIKFDEEKSASHLYGCNRHWTWHMALNFPLSAIQKLFQRTRWRMVNGETSETTLFSLYSNDITKYRLVIFLGNCFSNDGNLRMYDVRTVAPAIRRK